MDNLTFGEQVKIVLGRKGMTIKELAQIIEERTGKKMSRQNLTQRLGRDNFQEQDMRVIASILGCPFHLSIMDADEDAEVKAAETEAKIVEEKVVEAAEEAHEEIEEVATEEPEEYTLEEVVIDEPEEVEEVAAKEVEEPVVEEPVEEEPHEVRRGGTVFLRRQVEPAAAVEKEEKQEKVEVHHEKHEKHDDSTFEPIIKRNDEEENREVGDLNPYTGKEYQSNSVRMHPTRIGYIQVYDRKDHKWTDMTEWAFLGYQEREKIRLGDAYEPPIYLD